MKKLVFSFHQTTDYLFDYFFNKVDRSLPSTLVLGVSNRCNLSCPFCLNHLIPYKFDMSFSSFKEVVDKVKPFISLVDFSFNGEPLLNVDIFRMIRYAKSQGLDMILFTNGTLLDDRKGRELLGSGIDVVVINLNASLKGFYLQNSIEDLSLEWKEKINRFLDFAYTSRTLIVLKLLIRSKEEKRYLLSLQRLFHKNRNTCVMCQYQETYDYYPTRPKKVGRCHKLFHQLVVSHNGNVMLCCNDILEHHVMGNVFKESIEQVWKKKMNTIRKGNECQICMNCQEQGYSIRKMFCFSLLRPLPLRRLYYQRSSLLSYLIKK